MGRPSPVVSAVTCCCWMPDSRRFLSGGPDKAIIMFDTDGNELQRWRRQHRVQVRRARRLVMAPCAWRMVVAVTAGC